MKYFLVLHHSDQYSPNIKGKAKNSEKENADVDYFAEVRQFSAQTQMHKVRNTNEKYTE